MTKTLLIVLGDGETWDMLDSARVVAVTPEQLDAISNGDDGLLPGPDSVHSRRLTDCIYHLDTIRVLDEDDEGNVWDDEEEEG